MTFVAFPDHADTRPGPAGDLGSIASASTSVSNQIAGREPTWVPIPGDVVSVQGHQARCPHARPLARYVWKFIATDGQVMDSGSMATKTGP